MIGYIYSSISLFNWYRAFGAIALEIIVRDRICIDMHALKREEREKEKSKSI